MGAAEVLPRVRLQNFHSQPTTEYKPKPLNHNGVEADTDAVGDAGADVMRRG